MSTPSLIYPDMKGRVISGYRFTEFGLNQDRVWESHDLDSILYSVLMEILPLGDGMRRIGAMRDAIDEALRKRGREALGLPAVAPSADTPVSRARAELLRAQATLQLVLNGAVSADDAIVKLRERLSAAVNELEFA
jgi:hypothetical protein